MLYLDTWLNYSSEPTYTTILRHVVNSILIINNLKSFRGFGFFLWQNLSFLMWTLDILISTSESNIHDDTTNTLLVSLLLDKTDSWCLVLLQVPKYFGLVKYTFFDRPKIYVHLVSGDTSNLVHSITFCDRTKTKCKLSFGLEKKLGRAWKYLGKFSQTQTIWTTTNM